MKLAIRDEVHGLMKRGCFKVVTRSKIPNQANVLPWKYVPAIKYDEKDVQR